MTTEAPTGVVPAPLIRSPSAFPNRADRQNRTYNTKAEGWATSIVTTAEDMEAAAEATASNAQWSQMQAEAAEQIRLAAVQQTTAIKNQAVAETGTIRDQALAARDAAASSAATAQGLANYQGRWPELAGALAKGATVWHQGHYWGLLDNLADVTAAQPGQSTAWAAVGTQVHRLSYDQRDQLRTLGYPGLEWALVEGLGLFTFTQASTEPDDDETCFATPEGAWLLQCPAFDLVDAWMHVASAPLRDAVATLQTTAAPLRRSTTSSIATVAAGARVSFDVSIPGAVRSRSAMVSAPADLAAALLVQARVSALDTVTVYLSNPSAAAASVSTGEFQVTVI